MKQIVDKLNKIAKAIDENVDIPNTDLITDSLDAITTALGGTPNDSNLIVDKLEDIAGVAHGGGGGDGAPFLIEPQTITISIPDNPFPEIQVNDGGAGELPSVENILLKLDAGEEDRYYVLVQDSVNAFVFSDGSEILELTCNSDTHIWRIFYGEDTGGDDPEPVTGTFTFSAVGTW